MLTDFFDQVRIINVASRKDRRDETVSEFSRHGFQINTERVQFFDAVAPETPDGFPNVGVRGCFLSHLGVLTEALRCKARNVLVLEDDIQFSKHISKHGDAAIETLEELEWDIAYFGHAIRNAPGQAIWKKVDVPMQMTHLYAVNGKALESLTGFLNELLNRPPGHPDGGPMHYDGALNTFVEQKSDIKAYYYTVNLGYQRPSRTDLHELSVFDRNFLLKPITVLGRQLKTRILSLVR